MRKVKCGMMVVSPQITPRDRNYYTVYCAPPPHDQCSGKLHNADVQSSSVPSTSSCWRCHAICWRRRHAIVMPTITYQQRHAVNVVDIMHVDVPTTTCQWCQCHHAIDVNMPLITSAVNVVIDVKNVSKCFYTSRFYVTLRFFWNILNKKCSRNISKNSIYII